MAPPSAGLFDKITRAQYNFFFFFFVVVMDGGIGNKNKQGEI